LSFIKKTIFLFVIITFSVSAQNRLFVNQAGYLTNGLKSVVANFPSDSFSVVTEGNSETLFRGAFSSSFNDDALSGMNLTVGDFSSFATPGTYKVIADDGTESFPFNISDTVYNQVYRLSQKAFYFQRCGSQLVMANAGIYHHLACHTQDGFYHTTTGLTGFRYAVGGWHDAGDFGKYIVNAGISVGTLLMAYEVFPDYFAADDLNILESGNGVPDLLDEIRYELEWELKMQDSTGGVFTKLTPKHFSSFMMPEDDNSTRYLYQISSTATADFTAQTAKAYRVFLPFDSTFAAQCLTAATLAWEYLEQNPDIVPPGGFVNPDDTNTGEYGDGNDKDERLWAAAELFASTQDETYGNYYLNNFNSVGLFTSMSWQQVAPMAHLTYLLNVANPNEVTYAVLKSSLAQQVLTINGNIQANGFAIPLTDGGFYWGSNGEVLNDAVFLIAFDKLNQNNANLVSISKIFNYILGVNPHNQSFVSGVGVKRLMHPHHRQSESDGIDEPVPGLLAGGPNQYLNDATLQQLFNENTPPTLCYVDTVSSYASNEIAINWNAPLVFVAGYLNGKGNPTEVESDFGAVPAEINLYQNYPNPFNPDTNINFSINEVADVQISIYDILGRKITTLLNKRLGKGKYSIKVNSSTLNLTSGIYLYRLIAGQNSITKKMAVIK
jgi:endoglucanase